MRFFVGPTRQKTRDTSPSHFGVRGKKTAMYENEAEKNVGNLKGECVRVRAIATFQNIIMYADIRNTLYWRQNKNARSESTRLVQLLNN